MNRFKALLRQEPTNAEMAIVVAFAFACTAVAVDIAWNAYLLTPNVHDFRQFVHSDAQTKFETKGVYLFAPVIFMALALLATGTLLTTRGRNRARALGPLTRASLLFWPVFFLFGLWGTNEQASHALKAASRAQRNPPEIVLSP